MTQPAGEVDMNRRGWIVAGMVLVAPGLLCTCLLALFVAGAFMITTFADEWQVENRTAEPIGVTPVVVGDGERGPFPIRQSSDRLAIAFSRQDGEVLVQPGEQRRLVVDSVGASDIGGPQILIVRTSTGEHRYHQWVPDGHFILDDLTSLPGASDKMIAATRSLHGSRGPAYPLWLIAISGVVSPIALLFLRRAYRRLAPSVRTADPTVSVPGRARPDGASGRSLG
jgi:hypothetical protein